MIVDVVVPTCDRGILLNKCLESVAEQLLNPLKIVVVDNGRLFDLEYLQNRLFIDYIKIEAYSGASKARNEGFKHTTADLVAFLDDDDYWMPDYLKNALPLFYEGADIVVGKLMRQSEGGLPKDYKLLNDGATGLRKLYYSNPGFGGQNIIVRRELFEKLGGFDVNMPASNDRDFAVRAIQAGAKIRVQPLSVAVLCDHAGERVRHKQVMGNYLFIKKHWRYMRLHELARAVWTLSKRFIKVKLGR